jgi:Phage integrase, N-terminal SAM-like domain
VNGDPIPQPTPLTSAAAPPPPRLLDRVRFAAQQFGHPESTAFAEWSRRFILYHGKRHPRELGLSEVGQFLQSVAVTEQDPVRTLAASRDALSFLYHQVLHLNLGELPLPKPPRLLDQAPRGTWNVTLYFFCKIF